MGIYIDKVTFKKKKMLTMSDFHSHPYFEIYYLANGSRFFIFPNEETVKISTGDFLFVPPGVLHKTKGHLVSSFNIRIEEKDIPEQLYCAMISCADKMSCVSVPIDKRKYFEYQLSEIYNEFITREKYNEMMLTSRTITFLVDLIRFATERIIPDAEVAPDVSIEKIIAYIDENYTKPLTLKSLAKVANMSESHFSHYFKSKMATTPIEYINKLRISVALKYILEDNLTPAEIAGITGFKNTSYFCTVFKKYTGFTTNEYKLFNLELPDKETHILNVK